MSEANGQISITMHIGLLHDSNLPPKHYGGIERIMVALARAYLRNSHEVTLLCRAADLDGVLGGLRDNLEVRKRLHFFELPENYKELPCKGWLPKGLDFLHAHEPIKVELEFRPPIPFLITIHGNGSESEKYWPNTNFLSESHARNHNASTIVFNGVDPSRYPYVEKKQDYFVFLAKTTWRVKNLKTAITWANELGVRLEIMGGSGVSRGNINYHGLVDEPTKIKLLSNAKALIYPTNWDEPCAAAPLEALACGTPVITSANGCMPELVSEKTGVVCQDYSELLAAPEKLKKILPKDCRASVETRFSDERMAQDYLNLMVKIMNEGQLKQEPRFAFNKSSVHFLFKPSLINNLRLQLTGRI